MRATLIRLLLTIVSGLGWLSFFSAPQAYAGTNGQQLTFYNYSGRSSISWIRVAGINNYDQPRTWSRSFSPSIQNYSLNGWWWKGRTSVDWRMADGRTGGCLFDVPVSQTGDWNQVGVDRNGSSCWFS
jgi:hypothetical protein